MIGGKKKREFIINKKLLIASVMTLALLIAIIVYASWTSSKNTSDVHLTNPSTQGTRTPIADSALLKTKNETYISTQERKAKEAGKSFLGSMGSVNTITKPKTEIKQLNANDTTAYDFLAERKKRQQKEAPKKEVSKKVESDKLELSPAFLTKLDADMKDDKNKGQNIAFNTVVAPDDIDDFTESRENSEAPLLGKIMAGTTIYGIIKNKINTDFKDAPVAAEVSIGKYRNATIIGKFASNDQWVTGVFIQFNKMIYKGFEFKIDAIATNADYEPSLYDDVDNHWGMRIGGLLAGAGLGAVKGAAEPYSGANKPTVIISGGGETNDLYTPPDGKQVAFSAVGGAATDISSQLQPVFTNLWNRPATVTVKAGHGIGILFTATSELREGGNAK
jgi:type IV secretory pathway VirB10-like protein